MSTMSISKRIISLFLALVTLFSLLNIGVAVAAATPDTQSVKATAGETVKLEFSVNAYGTDGKIEYDNRALFASVTPSTSPYGRVTDKNFILSGSEKMDYGFTLMVKVSDSAKVGDECKVTITYLRVDNIYGEGPEDLVKTITVKIVEKATTATTKKPTSATTTTKPSSATTTKKPTGATTTKKPTSSVSNLDMTELNKQIDIAENLKQQEYTADSWAKMKTALEAAKKARRNASTQVKVDTAAEDLKNAVAALVRMDTAKLQELLNTVDTYLNEEELSDVKDALLLAIKEAEAAITSGDQSAVDSAYTELNAAFEAYKAKLEELGKGEIIEVEKPVPVEPTDPYCNISLHKLWLILLIVSAIINVVFVVLTVMYFLRRKKNRQDDTPLVNYDISDDA